MKTTTILPKMALACALYAFSGCKDEAPLKSDYVDKNGKVIISRTEGYNGLAFMQDLDYDSHIDAIILQSSGVAGKQYLAIDGNNPISRREAAHNIRKYILMDSSMIHMADEIADLENKLAYRIDSAFYASSVMHP